MRPNFDIHVNTTNILHIPILDHHDKTSQSPLHLSPQPLYARSSHARFALLVAANRPLISSQ